MHNNLQQLSFKLDKGTKTMNKLQGLLSSKSTELGQLIAQLEMIQQALAQIENGTNSVELGLKVVDLKIVREAEYNLDYGFELAKNVFRGERGVHKKVIQPSRIPQLQNKGVQSKRGGRCCVDGFSRIPQLFGKQKSLF